MGEHIASFCLGDDHLYKTLSENPDCRIMPSSYVNDPFVIAKNDNMISVNTALEMDLTGQVFSIAHPDFRGELRAEARKLGYVL